MSKMKMLTLAGLILGNSLYAMETTEAPEAHNNDMLNDTSSWQRIDYSVCKNYGMWDCVTKVGLGAAAFGWLEMVFGLMSLREHYTSHDNWETVEKICKFCGRQITEELYNKLFFGMLCSAAGGLFGGIVTALIGNGNLTSLRQDFFRFIQLSDDGQYQQRLHLIRDNQRDTVAYVNLDKKDTIIVDVIKAPNVIDQEFTHSLTEKVKNLLNIADQKENQKFQFNFWTKVGEVKENTFGEYDTVLFNQVDPITFAESCKLSEVIVRNNSKIDVTKAGLDNSAPEGVTVKGRDNMFVRYNKPQQ